MPELRASLARVIGSLSRVSGRGGGTTLPGRAMLALDPSALERLGAQLSDGSVLISATNGKTTTAAMLSRIVEQSGQPVLANRAGSNMPWGIVTTLLGDRDSLGLFEVDEAWLPEVAGSLEPRLIVLGNLFRDQLDRYGETESIASSWAHLVEGLDQGTVVAANADDPLIASVASEVPGRSLFFGIEDQGVALDMPPHAADARRCRRCGGRLVFDRSYLGHLGEYHCPACGLTRPKPDLVATGIELHGAERVSATLSLGTEEFRLDLPLPGIYNLYNALAAITAALALGIDLADALHSLESLPPVFGRAEPVHLPEGEARIFLVKNPVGANEVLRSLGDEEGPLDLWVALNDRIADGRDVSWIWDADFEKLAGETRSVVCSGTRAAEMAVRLKYAGLQPDSIRVAPEIGHSMVTALGNATGTLYALPTYTALLELKDYLADHRDLDPFWEETNQ